jgi:hypothetical protein
MPSNLPCHRRRVRRRWSGVDQPRHPNTSRSKPCATVRSRPPRLGMMRALPVLGGRKGALIALPGAPQDLCGVDLPHSNRRLNVGARARRFCKCLHTLASSGDFILIHSAEERRRIGLWGGDEYRHQVAGGRDAPDDSRVWSLRGR